MPVSNPSEFPPHRGNGTIVGLESGKNTISAKSFFAGAQAGDNSTIDHLVILGDDSGAGGLTNAVLAGSVIVGASNATNLTTIAQVQPGTRPVTIIGANILSIADGIDSSVLIGSGILPVFQGIPGGGTGLTTSVMVGSNILPLSNGIGGTTQSNVLIGANILTHAVLVTPANSVVLGANVLQNLNPSGQVSQSIFIGASCGGNVTGFTNDTICIGYLSTPGENETNSIVIGNNAQCASSSAQTGLNVVLGANTSYQGGLNVVLGFGAKSTNAPSTATLGNVCIGANAGSTLTSTASNQLVIEASTTLGGGSGNTPSALVYGSFVSGNLIFGASVQGTNRDLQGTNTVKLVNGTIGASNPIGGGYFYVAAGALHWVGSSGTDTPVAPA